MPEEGIDGLVVTGFDKNHKYRNDGTDQTNGGNPSSPFESLNLSPLLLEYLKPSL